MLKTDHIDVWGFEHAIRGMRNPKNSWEKSDSIVAFHALPNFSEDDVMAKKYYEWNEKYGLNLKIGPNDLDLMKRLYNGGSEHRKYLRQIMVSMDITAPLYWWKEFDTYKVGTVANSCSTMHKIHAKEFTLDDFSHEHLLEPGQFELSTPAGGTSLDFLQTTIDVLNFYRKLYTETNEKARETAYSGEKTYYNNLKKVYWWQLIQLLPSSYNQTRTVTMNYENVVTIIKQRSGHKLDEWHQLIDILKELPYVKEITN